MVLKMVHLRFIKAWICLVQLGLMVMVFNPFPNKPWFLRVGSTSPFKAQCEKEKLLVTSNFSFSHRVFYPFEGPSRIFITFEIVVCKLCLEESKICLLGTVKRTKLLHKYRKGTRSVNLSLIQCLSPLSTVLQALSRRPVHQPAVHNFIFLTLSQTTKFGLF